MKQHGETMYETSQPNSDHNKQDRPAKGRPVIKSLEQLSDWIDAQLAMLEEKYEAFATTESNRTYFKR